VEQPEITAITVTYNSARHIRAFIDSLRSDAQTTRLRLIVADNGSTDDTLRLLAEDGDVTVIATGANLGYAGGINAALPAVSAGSAVLILNPDLTVAPGAVLALLERMRGTGAGIVVPAIREGDGHLTHSLRREPTVARTLGDAVFGERLPSRGAALSELDRDPMSYRFPHRIDWATGAALLIRGDLWKRLGDWDERYFLYSEETDYFRRVRDAGESVWFEPGATVTHAQGGSGIRPEFTALMAVNRVRYAEATGGPIGAAGIRAATILHAGLRAYQPAQRAALRMLVHRAAWSHLPRAERRAAIVTDARGVA
jgi:GT2 family glycosyltransferase